jgi:ribonuclease VapC
MIAVDSSAILAVLFQEPGAAHALERMSGGVMSAVNHAETGAKMIARGWRREEWEDVVDSFGLTLVPFDRRMAVLSAGMAPDFARRGVSFADRACIVLGMIEKLPVLTGDRKWVDLGLDLKVELIR